LTALYIIGLSLSALVGLWHFTVPYLFQWYSYIPNEYKNLIVGIDWTNFFFSLLLSGYSLLLLAIRKKCLVKILKNSGIECFFIFYKKIFSFIKTDYEQNVFSDYVFCKKKKKKESEP
jgi:lipid-A-disaccharide synthase-like uncharacterized protein